MTGSELPLPTIEDIVRGIEAEVTHAAGKALSQWNGSDEAHELGVYFGYATDPVLRITVVPREPEATGPVIRTTIEVRYV